MIVDLIIAMFDALVLGPLNAALPVVVIPGDVDLDQTGNHVIYEYAGQAGNFLNAFFAVGPLLTIVFVLIAAALIMLPFAAILWAWNAVRP